MCRLPTFALDRGRWQGAGRKPRLPALRFAGFGGGLSGAFALGGSLARSRPPLPFSAGAPAGLTRRLRRRRSLRQFVVGHQLLLGDRLVRPPARAPKIRSHHLLLVDRRAQLGLGRRGSCGRSRTSPAPGRRSAWPRRDGLGQLLVGDGHVGAAADLGQHQAQAHAALGDLAVFGLAAPRRSCRRPPAKAAPGRGRPRPAARSPRTRPRPCAAAGGSRGRRPARRAGAA